MITDQILLLAGAAGYVLIGCAVWIAARYQLDEDGEEPTPASIILSWPLVALVVIVGIYVIEVVERGSGTVDSGGNQ